MSLSDTVAVLHAKAREKSVAVTLQFEDPVPRCAGLPAN